MNQYLEWAGNAKSFLPELVFTVLLGLAGCVGFVAIYYLLNRNGLQWIMAGSILSFLCRG